MIDLALSAFLAAFLALGLRRPFLWVLAYLYVDILAPQKISYIILASLPVSLIVFVAAFGGWLIADNKENSRFTLRQGLMVMLLIWAGCAVSCITVALSIFRPAPVEGDAPTEGHGI